ncbi:MAG: AMP-binding protein [Phenylobacterium sp.]|uniref:AMP-binding protein n=1 Tax=Phenylobacterium sp. TaxID=1871053 RepID=UPI0025CC1EAF|nr:AMP-binding protein [Phenylobacterium sp.]MBI1198676.1 AMP-binding protein [Phenylobacterium sp.]
MRFIDFFDRGAARYPDRLCLVDGGIQRTYREVEKTSHVVALALQAAGFEPGMKAGIYSRNSARLLECLLGVFRAAVAWVPLNARSTSAELMHVINLAECDVLFYDDKFVDTVAELRKACPNVKRFVSLSDDGPEGFHTFIAGHEGLAPDVPEDDERLTAVYSTGGTTGLPKGIAWRARVFEVMTANFFTALPCDFAPVHLAVAPLTHAAGGLALMLFAEGATQIILPQADPLEIMRSIEKHRVTHLFLPPTVIYMMLSHPQVREFDYSSMKYFVYTAAPMSADKLRQALDIFGPVMAQFFGQTEAPLACTVLTPKDHLRAVSPGGNEDLLKSCGRSTLFTRVEIMDSDGKILANHERGEIVVKSNLVMPGYYKDPAATAAVSEFGWHHTGDIAYRDDEGYFYIVDRKKDMIISGGFNVFPSEIERVLWAHPAVQDCAVIGVPDPKWGEAVKAVIELKPGASATEEELIRLCKAELGSVKAPKTIEFWPVLPRSPVGKVKKADIRSKYWVGEDRLV